jgi:hypothetical protein
MYKQSVNTEKGLNNSYLCDLKCWINRKIISGITAWETASSSGGRMGFPTWAWGPWRSQKPASFMTLVSPQSHAPPACDLDFWNNYLMKEVMGVQKF